MHENTGYKFADLSDRDVSKIVEAEKALNGQSKDAASEVILLAFKQGQESQQMHR